MDILFGKFIKRVFLSDDADFGIYQLRIHGGKHITAKVSGDQPDVRKTVEYKIVGEYEKSPKYGKQLIVKKFERFKAPKTPARNEIAIIANAKKRIGD